MAISLKEPKTRRTRCKSEADVWYEKMLAEFKVNGSVHLDSAKEKMGK